MVPHITMLDIDNNGIGIEVAVMKQDSGNGDLFFIRTDYLDAIDYERIRQILSRKDANLLPLWDLLSNITLPNGINALKYFHQYVQVKTESGQVMRPNARRSGISQKRRMMSNTEVNAQNAAIAVAAADQTKRKPGRPKNNPDIIK